MKRKPTSFLTAFLQANEHRWSKKIILQDLLELRREAAHLRSKERERELTSWEHKRIQECDTELIEIFARCLSAGFSRENLENLDSGVYKILELEASDVPASEARHQEAILATGAK